MKIAHIHVWDQNNKGDHAIVIAVQQLIHKHFANADIVDFPMEVLREGRASQIDEINTCDFVIIGGGGILYSYFLPFNTKLIERITSPICTFGIGYIREIGGRELTSQEKESIATLMKKASLVSVRDKRTQEFVIENGADENKVSLIGDPAVLMNGKKGSFEMNGIVKIGLNINYSGWLGFGEFRDDILRAYRQVAEYFQNEHDAHIYYCLHHPGEKEIYPELNIKNLTVIDLPPEEQFYAYSQLDLLIGMMLHSCVMAFGATTPEINVVYDIRNRNFAKFIGHPELAIEPDTLKQGVLLERAKEIFVRKSEYQKSFAAKKEEIQANHLAFIEKIKAVIKE